MCKLHKRSIVFSVIGIGSIIIGLFLYLIFRENTYITKLISSMINLDFLRKNFSLFENDFTKYYFADFLWALSLSCGMHIIFIPNIKKSLVCAIVVLVLGATYEVAQHFGVISGTGDIIDVILYLLAGLTVNLINIILIKKEEKSQ